MNLKQIQISKEIWKQAKLESIEQDTTIKKFVEDSIKFYIENGKIKQD